MPGAHNEQLFNLNGEELHSIEDLQDQARYIAVGREGLRPIDASLVPKLPPINGCAHALFGCVSFFVDFPKLFTFTKIVLSTILIFNPSFPLLLFRFLLFQYPL